MLKKNQFTGMFTPSQKEKVGQTERFKGMLGPKKRKKPSETDKLKKMLARKKVKLAGKKLGAIGRRSGMGASSRTQRGRIY